MEGEPKNFKLAIGALAEERAKIESGEIVTVDLRFFPDHIEIKYVGYKTVKLTA